MKRRIDEPKQSQGETKDSSQNEDEGSGPAGSGPSSFRGQRRGEHVAVAIAQRESDSDSTQESNIRSPKKHRRKRRAETFPEGGSRVRGNQTSEVSFEQVGDSSISRATYPADFPRDEGRRDNVQMNQFYEHLQEQELSALTRVALQQQAQSSIALGLPYAGFQQSAVAHMLESSNPLYRRLNPLGFPPQPPSLLDLLSIQTGAQRPSSLQHMFPPGLSSLQAASRGISPLETMALASQADQRNPYSTIFPPSLGAQQQSLESLIIQEQQRQLLVNGAISIDRNLGGANVPPPFLANVPPPIMAPPQQQASPVAAPVGDDLFIPALRRQFPGGFVSDNRTVILAIPEDRSKLNSQQVFLRHQIEVFRASHDDILSHTRGRNRPVMLGQCGIRCRHCGHLPVAKRSKGSTYFPSSVTGIYQATQNLSVTHLQSGLCTEMPFEMKQQFAGLMSSKVASCGVGRPYWAEAARKLGLVDTPYGIRFRDDVPPGGVGEPDDPSGAFLTGERNERSEG